MNSADLLAPESRARLLSATGAESCQLLERVQSLWSGYGSILRVELLGGQLTQPRRVIVKEVRPPGGRARKGARHPRGWDSDRSHERKLRSYAAEMHFYVHSRDLTDESCRVPQVVDLAEEDVGWWFVFEDLDTAGYPRRRSSLSPEQCRPVLRWLAHFHAHQLVDRRHTSSPPTAVGGLWPRGTYWHLETRPDEFEVLNHDGLRAAAAPLDRRLSTARFFTVVHGDAKVANFCFNDDLSRVAAVDFQYVGGGVGVQDVAYFFSSCLTERQLERHAAGLLDEYFGFLQDALCARRGQEAKSWAQEVEAEWRSLYAIAWADFMRFLLGWAPGHSKIHGYSRAMVEQATRALQAQTP